MFPADLPDQLKGFFISRAGDCTGIDQVYICRNFQRNNAVAVALKQFKQKLYRYIFLTRSGWNAGTQQDEV